MVLKVCDPCVLFFDGAYKSMIFVMSEGELLADDGCFIKRLSCPRNRPEILHSEGAGYVCVDCERHIHCTAKLSDDQVLALIKQDPEACLLISDSQDNMRFVES